MQVIPAIDLKEGYCVRLLKGDFDKETVYSKEPVQMAKYWQEQGARRLHMVDLDGARDGKPKNLEVISKIASKLKIPVQLGGGIRTLETIDYYLDSGVDRVILGTAALQSPELVETAVEKYGSSKIVVGVDARKGIVSVNGWLEDSEKTVDNLIAEMKEKGVSIFIYTDITRDGTLEGPDIEGMGRLNKIKDIEIIASGGVSSIDDLKNLQEIGVKSAIVGKALYTTDIDPDLRKLDAILNKDK